MAIHVCFAIGMSDCMPNEQAYERFDDAKALRERVSSVVAEVCHQHTSEIQVPGAVYPLPVHVARQWSNGAQGSWRVFIATDEDLVVDVICMTEAEWRVQSVD